MTLFTMQLVMVWCGLAVSCVPCVAFEAIPRSTTATSSVPTFSITDLLEHTRRHELQSILSTTGLFAVRLLEEGLEEEGETFSSYTKDRQTAFQGLCECHMLPSFLQLQNTRSIRLQDDMTLRTSVATATVGMDHPLPLPQGLDDTCGHDTLQAMEGLRDALSSVSKAFVHMLDDWMDSGRDKNSAAPVLLKDKYGNKAYSSITSIVQAANHLEHFHVYTKEEHDEAIGNNSVDRNDISTVPWDWHTDAGLFLVFVPAWNCHAGQKDNKYDDSAFWYKDQHGNMIQAQFDGPNTVIVMLGQGAQDWLDLASLSQRQPQRVPKLKAAVHSVRWGKQQQQQLLQRAWYGMMFLVPETAMVYGMKTLKEVRSSLSLSVQNNNGVAEELMSTSIDTSGIGCGVSEPTLMASNDYGDFDGTSMLQPQRRRRRLQHQDPSTCNNVTNFFCWMQCLDIPSASQAQGYVNEGYSLYCLDPAILASSGNKVSQAVAPCENGWVHNANCVGSWQPTAPGVPVAAVNATADVNDVDHPFCYSGTTMYMDGFHLVQSTTCIIYLFQSWVLNTGGKYAVAVFGTIFAGVGLERTTQQRRKIMALMEGGRKRLLVSAAFYGIQLTIGYLLMLVIMIYSGVFFIATVFGLVCGHVMFNAKDALWPLDEAPSTTDKVDSCSMENRNCTNVTGEGGSDQEGSAPASSANYGACCGPNKDNLPEGHTPCCAHESYTP